MLRVFSDGLASSKVKFGIGKNILVVVYFYNASDTHFIIYKNENIFAFFLVYVKFLTI